MTIESTDISQAIATIGEFYPIDYDNGDTVAIGKELLFKAIMNTGADWRTLPQSVLIEYARLCQDDQTIDEIRVWLVSKKILFED